MPQTQDVPYYTERVATLGTVGLAQFSALNAHIMSKFVHIDRCRYNNILWQTVPFVNASLTEGVLSEPGAYSGFERLH